MNNPIIAKTILAQLGNNRFVAMTGAKNFIDYGNGLGFKLPANSTKNRISHVKIILNGMDTYDIEFLKIRKFEVITVAAASDVYAENLHDVFEEHTGLYTTLVARR